MTKDKKSVGRPRIEKPKSKYLYFRVDEETKDKIERIAKAQGKTSANEFMRDVTVELTEKGDLKYWFAGDDAGD